VPPGKHEIILNTSQKFSLDGSAKETECVVYDARNIHVDTDISNYTYFIVTTRSKAWTDFARSSAGIVASANSAIQFPLILDETPV
jgi:hypothetical protein